MPYGIRLSTKTGGKLARQWCSCLGTRWTHAIWHQTQHYNWEELARQWCSCSGTRWTSVSWYWAIALCITCLFVLNKCFLSQPTSFLILPSQLPILFPASSRAGKRRNEQAALWCCSSCAAKLDRLRLQSELESEGLGLVDESTWDHVHPKVPEATDKSTPAGVWRVPWRDCGQPKGRARTGTPWSNCGCG